MVAAVIFISLVSCSSQEDLRREPTEKAAEQSPSARARGQERARRQKCTFTDTTGIYDPFVPSSCLEDLRPVPWDSIRILKDRPDDPVLIAISDETPRCLGLHSTSAQKGRRGPVVTVVGGHVKRRSLCRRAAIPAVIKTHLFFTPKRVNNIIDGSTIPKVRRRTHRAGKQHDRE
jgi:hypothetical protein